MCFWNLHKDFNLNSKHQVLIGHFGDSITFLMYNNANLDVELSGLHFLYFIRAFWFKLLKWHRAFILYCIWLYIYLHYHWFGNQSIDTFKHYLIVVFMMCAYIKNQRKYFSLVQRQMFKDIKKIWPVSFLILDLLAYFLHLDHSNWPTTSNKAPHGLLESGTRPPLSCEPWGAWFEATPRFDHDVLVCNWCRNSSVLFDLHQIKIHLKYW